MCEWQTAGECMSFTNVSMGNSWGMHVFHKCVNGKQLGNACLSQMCQWGTHVFHKCVNGEQLGNACLSQMINKYLYLQMTGCGCLTVEKGHRHRS